MRIVIDIDNKLYEIIKNPKKLETMYHAGRVCEAVRNGTPLPKGHGRLIDGDLLETKLIYESDLGAEIETYGTDDVIKRVFEKAQTIIEADKAESEESQPKQIVGSCLDFDFDKVKEILKKDGLDNLIVDHTCEEK